MLQKTFTRLNMYALCFASTLSAADIVLSKQLEKIYVPKTGEQWASAQKVIASGKIKDFRCFKEEYRAADRTHKTNHDTTSRKEIAEFARRKRERHN